MKMGNPQYCCMASFSLGQSAQDPLFFCAHTMTIPYSQVPLQIVNDMFIWRGNTILWLVWSVVSGAVPRDGLLQLDGLVSPSPHFDDPLFKTTSSHFEQTLTVWPQSASFHHFRALVPPLVRPQSGALRCCFTTRGPSRLATQTQTTP